MAKDKFRFCVQVGNLVYEAEGSRASVLEQISQHRDHILKILNEQTKLIKRGKVSLVDGEGGVKRGAVGESVKAGTKRGRRGPGRQPLIVRESDLKLKPRALGGLRKYLEGLAGDAQLGKDATIFGIAHYLCTEVFERDTFTAGDVMAAHGQLGEMPFAPSAPSVDAVQMLRNLAATSVGKMWVARHENGTFALTSKGRRAARSGKVVRRRGRRPLVKRGRKKSMP